MKLVEKDSELEHQELAVLYADIYNYSKLTEEDQDFTHKNLRERLLIVEKIVKKNFGIVNRLVGDSVLVTFKNISDAIYAAAEIQAASHKQNFDLDINDQLLYRIGITYGDVIFDKCEPYGNIVNLASRLEGLVEPGGVYITEYAYSKLETALPFHVVYRGKLKVKNIKEPVTVNEIILKKPVSYRTPIEINFLRHVDGRLLLISSLFVLVISILIFIFSLGILYSVEAVL